jgi:TonB family protein
MPVSILLAATALAAPQYSVDLDDYPDKALAMEKSAAVLADVTVTPHGNMIRCETIDSTGDPDLAQRICKIFKAKRHRPARYANGKPAWFVERDVYKMFLPGTSPVSAIAALRKPDAILEVAALPPGMQTLDANVIVAVDTQGHVTGCAPDAGDEVTPVIRAVCGNTDTVAREVFRDDSGNAVPYVTRLRFRLQIAAKGTAPVS